MKDYELLRSRFAQPFLSRFCMFCAYTRPRYQVSVYRTIGPLVLVAIDPILFELAVKKDTHILEEFEFRPDWTTDNQASCP